MVEQPPDSPQPPPNSIDLEDINRLYSKPAEVKLLEKEQKLNRLKYELEKMEQERTELTRDILLLNEKCDTYKNESELTQSKLDQVS